MPSFLLMVLGLWSAGDLGRPNIVVILADDLGFGDVQAFHPANKIATPRLDELARQGVRLTNAHTPCSICTPTRYALVTGQYCWRTRLKRGVLGGLSPALIDEDRPTIASFLHGQGYRTACVGKWHLGMNWVVKPGKSVDANGIEKRELVFNVEYDMPITRGPTTVGFDRYFGIAASLDMIPYTYISQDHVLASPTEDRDFPWVLGEARTGRTRKGPAAPDFEATEVLDRLADEAAQWIREQADVAETRPFFLYLPLASPHTPIVPTREWLGKSGINPYADFVMATDAAVGRVLDELDRSGLTENTLVLFSSDNGCSPSADFEALAAAGHFPGGPYRGGKFDIFEGGSRVPTIARWPGKVPVGTTNDAMLGLIDIFPTVADLLGQKLADGAAPDGESFLPVLLGESKPARRPLVVQSSRGMFAILDGHWKFCDGPDSGGHAEPRPGSPKAKGLYPVQLYDLSRDPGETMNQAESQRELADGLLKTLDEILAGDADVQREPL